MLPRQVEVDPVAATRGADGGVVAEAELQLGVLVQLALMPDEAGFGEIEDGEDEEGLVGRGALGLGPRDIERPELPEPSRDICHGKLLTQSRAPEIRKEGQACSTGVRVYYRPDPLDVSSCFPPGGGWGLLAR